LTLCKCHALLNKGEAEKLNNAIRRIRNKSFFAVLIGLFIAAVIVSVAVPASRAFAIISFLLVISALIVVRNLWKDSVSSAPKAVAEDAYPKLRDNLASMKSNVKSASRGSRYSQEEAAKILREAFLGKFVGHGRFPESWVSSQSGKGAIENILKSNNREDLIDVLEPPEKKLNREEYLRKLDNTLKLLEA
jgi:hypothetical protein